MEKPSQKKPSLQTKPRSNIANLFAIAKKYKLNEGATLESPVFSLVNENEIKSDTIIFSKEHDFTRDELIAFIGMAAPEFVDFIKEYSGLLAQNQAMMGVLNEAHYNATGRKAEDGADILKEIADASTLGRQALDVLRNIAHNTPLSEAKGVAMKFVQHRDNLKEDTKIISLS